MKNFYPLLLAFFFLHASFSAQSQEKKQPYTDFNRAEWHWFYDKWDSAYYFFNRYVDSDPVDQFQKARAYKFMGEMQWYIGDWYGAEENLNLAKNELDSINPAHAEELSFVYNILGNISLELKQYNEAIGFYNKALHFAGNNAYKNEVLNGKATALRRSGRLDDAIAIYNAALATENTDKSLLARLIDNRAVTQWKKDPAYDVLPEFRQALQIRLDSQYQPGLITSYEHLADYYSIPQRDSALWYAGNMYATATQIGSSKDRLEAIQRLVSLNDKPLVKEQWFGAFKSLNDSFQLSKDTTRNRFALIRYDYQKSKADNLVLQKNIHQQRLISYGIGLLAAVAIISLLLWYRKRRKKIQAAAEKEIQASRLKTSQKVHDVVANGLYRIMNELEHTDAIDKDPLIDKIEGLYEQSRNISHEDMPPPEDHTLHNHRVHEMLQCFADDTTKVFIIGNQPSFWEKIPDSQRQELYLVLNELMVNMKKHSSAKNVSVQFGRENDKAVIRYKDDGIGLKIDPQTGIGTRSTVNRIKSLNGHINFEANEAGGLSIHISLPLQPFSND